MLLNCGVGEDSWESLGLQGDPTSPFWRRSVLSVHWEDWCWSWNSNILTTWCKELTHWKRPWCWERLRLEEKGTTEDEMVGWHHQLSGHGFRWTSGVGDGQGGLACCDSWGHKESDTTEQLNWTELNAVLYLFRCFWLQITKTGTQNVLKSARRHCFPRVTSPNGAPPGVVWWASSLPSGRLFQPVALRVWPSSSGTEDVSSSFRCQSQARQHPQRDEGCILLKSPFVRDEPFPEEPGLSWLPGLRARRHLPGFLAVGCGHVTG